MQVSAVNKSKFELEEQAKRDKEEAARRLPQIVELESSAYSLRKDLTKKSISKARKVLSKALRKKPLKVRMEDVSDMVSFNPDLNVT